MTIITIANQKGGVGKTTTAAMLAHGAARRDKRVLLIDLDTQGNCADSFGVDEAPSLYEWLVLGKKFKDSMLISVRENLDLIRSDKHTAQLLIAAAGMDYRENILANALQDDEHDLVVLDCPPSVNLLHTAALVAADLLIIPTKLDQFAVKGVIAIMYSLASVKQNTKSTCTLAGIIPTFYERVTSESQAQLEILVENYGHYVWPPIPSDTTVRVASRKGITPWEFDGNGRALEGYSQCLDRLLKII
jgi:chromosome partitioning protein